MDAAQWVSEEFCHLDFGDTRLRKRFLKVAKDFARQPGMSTNSACKNWSETKAAYRLFENEKVKTQNILASHVNNTVLRSGSSSVILAIQDTCYLDFRNHKKAIGVGKTHRGKNSGPEGLVMHTAYMISPSGLPLGFGYQKIWGRKDEIKQKPHYHWLTPIEQKESFKWIDTIRSVKETLGDSASKVIHVCDREADIYEFYCEANRIAVPIIVRAKHDRSINRKNRLAKSGVSLRKTLEEADPLGSYSFKIAARKHSPERVATVQLKSIKFTLCAPMEKKAQRGSYMEKIELSAVQVLETDPPEGSEALEWILLSNLNASTFEEAENIAKAYVCRWKIEEFHRILKSGCRAENCRMQSADKLIKHITVKAIIAWKIHWLTKVARDSGNIPCNVFFAEAEWKGLYSFVNKTRHSPEAPPSLRDFIRSIANLGGFLGRKSDGEPGAETIWKGLHALFHIAKCWEALTGRGLRTCG